MCENKNLLDIKQKILDWMDENSYLNGKIEVHASAIKKNVIIFFIEEIRENNHITIKKSRIL